MREIMASITQRGQVTIPVEIQRLLGLKPRGKVSFVVEAGQVRLAAPRYTLESAFGAVEPLNRPENFEELILLAKEEHAERVVQKMRRE